MACHSLFFLLFCAETIIPVCPPACGQAYYAAGVIPISSGPLVAIALLVASILR
jgi:neuronal growth regulator 1